MIFIAARPAMGKSTLALDLCRAASIHNGLASVFFSLAMGRAEITMRLLSAEAKVPLNHIRNGNMTDDAWARLARKMGEVSSAPMFIRSEEVRVGKVGVRTCRIRLYTFH